MSNPIQWLEIAATDLERAKTFYASVFNLEFEYIEMPDSKMYMFGAPGEIGSAGCIMWSEQTSPGADGTTAYFSCEDLSNELGRVEAAGGKIVVPRTDIGEFGVFAQVLDTEGNRIGLHSNQ